MLGTSTLMLLWDLTSRERQVGTDPKWKQLLSKNHSLLSLLDVSGLLLPVPIGSTEVEGTSVAFMHRLVENNPVSFNVLELCTQASDRLKQINSDSSDCAKTLIDEACVALHLLSLILAQFTSSLTSASLRKQLCLMPEWPNNNNKQHCLLGDGIVSTLVNNVLILLCNTECDLHLHDLLFASANLLLCCFSTQLFKANEASSSSSSSASDDLFLSYVYSNADYELRAATGHGGSEVTDAMPAKLVRGLLHHLSGASNKSQKTTDSKSLHLEDRKNGWGMLLFSFISQFMPRHLASDSSSSSTSSSTSSSSSSTSSSASPLPSCLFTQTSLAERSAGLLLLLLHNNRSSKGTPNSFREIFSLLCDEMQTGDTGEELEVEMLNFTNHQRGREHLIPVSFLRLADCVTSALLSITTKQPNAVALLSYSLLLGQLNFLQSLVRFGKASKFVSAVLFGLYSVNEQSVECLYLRAICTLILVQEPCLRPVLSTTRADAAWYKERSLLQGEASLADLIVLCVLRCVLYATFRLQDSYLSTNCLAVLLDLAPLMSNISAYASERLVFVICQLCRRVIRMQDVEAAQNEQILPVAETLCCLLKFVFLATRPQKRLSNAYLVYALIHEHEAICEILMHPAVQQATSGSEASVSGLYELTRHFYSALLVVNVEGHFLSATQAMRALIRLIGDESPKEDSNAAEQSMVSFAYEEGENPDLFFVPLVWQAVINNT